MMRAIVSPGSLGGCIGAVSSKSMAHRLLILASLLPTPCKVEYNATSEDIEATRRCLDAIAQGRTQAVDKPVMLDCGESGSTLRFLLPVVCAMGLNARFVCHGRLASRPLAPLDRELVAHGATVLPHDNYVDVSGRMSGGMFALPGNVSSQFVSGLLMAAPLTEEPVEVYVCPPVQSRPYIMLTAHALEMFGQSVTCEKTEVDGATYERFTIDCKELHTPDSCVVEGDWSNAAFWLAAGAMEPEGITVTGLNLQSAQGDRAILAALAAFGSRIARRGNAARATADTRRSATLDVRDVPDLVPPLAAVAATAPGTSRFTHADRLRLKESDRLASISHALRALGAEARVEDNSLVVFGQPELSGGFVDSYGDHRIAMMAAIMATHASDPVTIGNANCVAKSYPDFWDDYARLGGRVTFVDEEEG